MDRNALLKTAELVFFKAMVRGYASGAKATPIAHRPGWKLYTWEAGEWRVEDGYYVNPDSGRSFGVTTIAYQTKEVWMMSYAGHYDDDALECLKARLMANYEAGIFNAGRGSAGTPERNYRYHIETFGLSRFEDFSAFEWITREDDGVQAGNHRIMGRALI